MESKADMLVVAGLATVVNEEDHGVPPRTG